MPPDKTNQSPEGQPPARGLKELRQARREWTTRAAARVKEQNRELKAIKARLGQGPATPLEVAEASGLPPDKAMWYLAALKKYGQVVEEGKDKAAGCYRYALVQAGEAAPEDDNAEVPASPAACARR